MYDRPWCCTQSANSALAPGQQHHLTVDTRRAAPSVDLRDPPHAEQRVRPGTEHQLLQVPDPFEVPCLCCREDSLPQTPYVVVDCPPVDRRPVAGDVLRSVHHGDSARRDLRRGDQLRRHGVQLALRFRCHRSVHVLADSPGPRRHPFGPGNGPYPASYPGHDRWRTSHRCLGFLLPFGHRRSLLGPSCSRWGVTPSSRSADRPAVPLGPQRGFHVPHERDTTGVGAPFTPRRRCPPDRATSTIGACRFSTASPAPRCNVHRRGSR